LTRIIIDDRKDKTGNIDRKVRSVEEKLGRTLKK